MLARLIAIAVIFAGAGIAWMILAGTLATRTDDSDSSQRQALSTEWGAAQMQRAPQVFENANGAELPLRSSHIDVKIDLDPRQKGLLWYDPYDVSFAAHYTVRNDTKVPHLCVTFTLPSNDASYADLTYRIGDRQIDNATALGNTAVAFDLAPGATTTIDVAYRTRGMDTWTYRFGKGVQSVNDFSMTMRTNFPAIDFPSQTLPPVKEEKIGDERRLIWTYGTLVTGYGIGMVMPVPMQPGPLAQRITMWAPVGLLFYFFAMLLITAIRKIDLHPMNYFFLGCAFFAFHLLFAYLVDRIPIGVAFTICSLVSMFLTITYLRLVVGWRFAAVESGFAQLVYLILFSYALFNEGWSGLTITIGAIVTLFLAMQLTGRINWGERFASKGRPLTA